MPSGPIHLLRPSDDYLAKLVHEATTMSLSYEMPGMTRTGHAPEDFLVQREEANVGEGSEAFDIAIHSLDTWQVHRDAGLRVVADGVVRAGATVVLVVRLAAVYLSVACRIIYTVEEADRHGFAYGTLDHHVESGEELFAVERDVAGHVSFSVTSYSRPGHLATALSGPIGRWIQHAATKRYVQAMQAAVARPS